MKMEILLEPTSNKLMVEHAEYDESNTYVLERFNTTAGNPVKKILLKLNLSDHRLFKDGGGDFRYSDTERLSRSDEVLKLKKFKKDATLKLFKSTNQERGNKLKCTLWGAFTQQFSELFSTCSDHAKIIMILQLAMMKMWDGKMCVQNGYHGTKLFLFDGTIPIVNEEFSDVKEYTIRLFAKQDIEKTKNMATQLLDVAHGVASIIVGTIIAIQEEEGRWYIGCKGCKNKVIRSSDMVDLEADVPKKTSSGFVFKYAYKTKVEQCRYDEVQAVVDRSAYQLCDKYGKMKH
ncbi:hypothetical protein Tco_1345328 [Tanacetum coccineum]